MARAPGYGCARWTCTTRGCGRGRRWRCREIRRRQRMRWRRLANPSLDLLCGLCRRRLRRRRRQPFCRAPPSCLQTPGRGLNSLGGRRAPREPSRRRWGSSSGEREAAAATEEEVVPFLLLLLLQTRQTESPSRSSRPRQALTPTTTRHQNSSSGPCKKRRKKKRTRDRGSWPRSRRSPPGALRAAASCVATSSRSRSWVGTRPSRS